MQLYRNSASEIIWEQKDIRISKIHNCIDAGPEKENEGKKERMRAGGEK